MSRRVLLIDDEDHIREVAVLTLETIAHWTVFDAASGEEGIARAEREHPDAILLDVMMPGMDGATTFQRLQSHPSTKDIPVVFLTAKVQETERRRLLALGVHGLIAKPFDPLTLAAQVADAIGW